MNEYAGEENFYTFVLSELKVFGARGRMALHHAQVSHISIHAYLHAVFLHLWNKMQIAHHTHQAFLNWLRLMKYFLLSSPVLT